MAYTNQDVSAKEQFKKLIVTSIADCKRFYNEIVYNSFYNSVEMLDCIMESYKKDPLFNAQLKLILKEYSINIESLKNLEIVNVFASAQQQNVEQKKLYLQWLRLLIDLANRTVFSGREMDVDINLAEVMINLKALQMDGETKKSTAGLEYPIFVEQDITEKSMPDSESQEDEAKSIEEPDNGAIK